MKNPKIRKFTVGKPQQFNSRREWEEFIWEKIVVELASAQSSKELKSFLERIISDYEKKLIIRRLTAIILIQEGLSYSQIGELLWLSPTTISTMKKNLNQPSKNYNSRKKFPNVPRKYSAIKNFPAFEIKNQSMAEILKKIHSDIFKSGYTNMKERWKFLREY